MPYEVSEIANLYTLLSIGLTYTDISNLPAETADNLLKLHKEVKQYEEDSLKKK